ASWPFTTGRSTATAAGPSWTSSSPSTPASARLLNSRQPKPALPNWAGARQRRATSAPPVRPNPEPLPHPTRRTAPNRQTKPVGAASAAIRHTPHQKAVAAKAPPTKAFEAKTDTNGTGEYHGYPLEPEDAMHDYVRFAWKEKCQRTGR